MNRNPNNSSIMETMRANKQVLSIVHALVGGALLAAGAIMLALHFFLDHNVPGHTLLIVGGSLVFSGVVELSVLAIIRRAIR
ncbi:MAG: hypothetical protein FWD06_04650 [Oscillospiraceae bacterium]|nr:hypothetical protein [Oscillospiraceae bacterium]